MGGELASAGLSPEDVARGLDEHGRGAWLRELPFAAKIGSSFFVHAGDTEGRDVAGLERHVRGSLERGGFGHDDLVGEDGSLLGAKSWEQTVARAKANAEALGVERIVMGHIAKALDAPGEIARTADGLLVKLDTGLGAGDAPARLLRISRDGKLRQLDAHGVEEKLAKYR